MELRDYLRILHKYWISIVALTLLGVIAAAGISLSIPPKYEATTQLYVSARGESSAIGDLAQGSNLARQSVATYAGIVGTESVLGPVVKELGLERTATQLAADVTATAPVNQSLINISVVGQDAERTAKIANAIGASLSAVVEGELEAGDGEEEPSLVSLSTVQPALVPSSPTSPNLKLNLALGALLGLALGVGQAVLRSTLDTRIHSSHDIEQITEAPMLGGITYDPEAKSRPLVVHADPRSSRAESFRTLRTNLQFLAVHEENEKARSFVVTSAGASEGKSTTTANLAIALSETGARVLLIDGDLRKPKVAEYMGIEGGAGLTNVLINQAELVDVMQRWGRGQLYLLPAGKVPPNPSELLGSKSMDELLNSVKEHFDFILIDAPPLLLVTDAAVVSKFTNGALLVAASGQTRKQELHGAVRSLGAAGAKLLGVIVTMLPTKGPDSYSYGAYGAYGGYAEAQEAQLSDTDSLKILQAGVRRGRGAERA
ncbi:polysaccharide biosynthesis tyrosine autokinase [Leucobacter denitrificans]|uniref:non-specific protein-tyrosine kinase n=1 Tax=Leucobacter denitrificans TaxID=683042 RepID=A0A7G9S7A8_9MICO|nr:polysaccharide biosynthesis tyrosine autokinase [Leucobacter denitrificans]QNN63733.1 polysaccharide biosynthesis tyrosine autokinase [Leucobacter denitrificans]